MLCLLILNRILFLFYYSALLDEGNEWLDKNRDWEVINCETVLLFFKKVRGIPIIVRCLKELLSIQSDNGILHMAPEDTCFPLDAECQSSLWGLRLWIQRKSPPMSPTDKSRAQEKTHKKLKYVDFVPRPDADDKNSRFRKLDAFLERVNREIQEGKTDRKMGDIITIETLYHPVATSEWKIDEKNSLNLFPSRCISILRIFYQEADRVQTSFPTITIKDFIPKQVSGGGFFKMPVFESFSAVLTRASEWISANPECQFKNAQCLEVKMKTMGRIDSKIMSHSGDRGDYVRIFRVACIKEALGKTQSPSPTSLLAPGTGVTDVSGDTLSRPPPPPIFLSTIIFTPADQDATVQEIKRKIHEWVVQATDGQCPHVSQTPLPVH